MDGRLYNRLAIIQTSIVCGTGKGVPTSHACDIDVTSRLPRTLMTPTGNFNVGKRCLTSLLAAVHIVAEKLIDCGLPVVAFFFKYMLI